MPSYAKSRIRRYRKSNTMRKARRFFRTGRAAYTKYSKYNSKYRRTKVTIPTRVLPDYTLVKMKCSSTWNIGAGSTPAVGQYSFASAFVNGNDIYDPFGVFATDQPNGFDQWMAFYQNFIVHKSSIKVTPVYWVIDPGQNGGPIMPFQLTIVPFSLDATFPSLSTTNEAELPYARTKLYTGSLPQSNGTQPLYVASQTPGEQTNIGLVHSMMTKKILGYKDLSDVLQVRGSESNSPGQRFQYAIVVRSTIPGAGASLVNYRLSPLGIRVDMYFKCQLLNRKDVPDSITP